MEGLQVFQNAEFGQIRTITVNGEPWFVASDICKALDISNTTQAAQRLDTDEKSMLNIGLSGGATNCVNEYGLYTLVLASRKPGAKNFRRWITHEVIPSIRQHGAYMTEQVIERTLTDPDYLIQLATTLKEEREKRKQLELENAQKEQIIQEMQPKVSYYDLVLQAENLVPISKIAKDYGMSATQLNGLLYELGVQYKMSGTWLLYQKYAAQGYTQSKTHVVKDDYSVMHTYWTQKGRLFIYDLLKNQKGILPLIERNEEEGSS